LTITRPPPAHAVTGPEFVTLILNSKEQPPGEKHQLMLMIGNRLAIIGYSLMRLSRRADFPIFDARQRGAADAAFRGKLLS
jgi:hypothetical protein